MLSLRHLLPRTHALRTATRATVTTRTTPPSSQSTSTRFYSSSSSSSSSSPTTPFQQGPSPPRLPPAEQAEFERLQRAVADRFADPTPLPHEKPHSTTAGGVAPAPSPANTTRHESTTSTTAAAASAAASAAGTDTPAATAGVWRGARPEFEGDTNPRTGEVGGPKTEPLRWGSGGDWSYNGRVTDF